MWPPARRRKALLYASGVCVQSTLGDLPIMRRFVLIGLVCVCSAAAYVAMPFYTAWSIREAIRAGNSTYLADKMSGRA